MNIKSNQINQNDQPNRETQMKRPTRQLSIIYAGKTELCAFVRFQAQIALISRQFIFYCVVCTFAWPINYKNTIIIYHTILSLLHVNLCARRNAPCRQSIDHPQIFRPMCAKCTTKTKNCLNSKIKHRRLSATIDVRFLVFTTFC